MANVEMHLRDVDKRVILGLPPTAEKKVHNPFHEAMEMEKAGKRREAESTYIELLNVDFDNPAILSALGMNFVMSEKNGLAHVLLQKALANVDGILDGLKRLGITVKADKQAYTEEFLKAQKSQILNAIGTCYKHENKIDIARSYFEQAQALVPLNPDIQNNLGTLYINEGKPEDAIRHLEMALSISPEHAQSRWNRSLAHLELGNYAQGWPDYYYGIAAHVRQDRMYGNMPLPQWDGTPGKRLIIYGEQGIGDEILFASVLPDLLKDCPQTVFECHKKLHTLFANSFPDLPIYPTREDEVITWPLKPDRTMRYEWDAKLAIGDLPRFYRKKLADFPGEPFLHPTPKSELRWNERLAQLPAKPKIGISWQGGHKRTRQEVRSVNLEMLLPILSQEAEWISLQYTPVEDELAEFTAKHGITIHHWPEAVASANYDDTAGLVANLDLVITVCTSVVHLAGALGVPCWVLTPSRPAWRYRLDLEYMPWYPSVTLFRQKAASADWQPVVAEVAQNLSELLGGVK